MFGGAGFNFSNQVVGGIAPPATGRADNGLSIDPVTGDYVLGNDVGGSLAKLLSIRAIELNGFEVDFTGQTVGPNTTSVNIQDSVIGFFCIGGTQNGGLFILDLVDGSQASFLYSSATGLQIGWPSAVPTENVCVMTGGAIQFSLQSGELTTVPSFNVDLGSPYSGISQNFGIRLGAQYNSAVGQPNLFFLDLQDTLSAANALFTRYATNGVNQWTVDKSGNLISLGSLQSGDPGNGTAKWKMGKVIAAGVALDATHYVETTINGAIVKLGIVV